MKHAELDPKLKLNHHLTAMEFIAKTVCVSCVLKEGQCSNFLYGEYEDCYKHCRWFKHAVDEVTKILNKYDS